jgi:maleate isomerase
MNDTIVGIVKPSIRVSKSLDELAGLLPTGIRLIDRTSPVEKGTLEEFERALPAYRLLAHELAQQGAQMIHLEGTPPFLLAGRQKEQKFVADLEQELGLPVFTSTMCQANALKALKLRKIIDLGYDPTTGPPVVEYFQSYDFDILCVEKAPVDWLAKEALSDEAAYSIFADFVRRNPAAECLCLQGSSKWPLSKVIDRVENDFNICVIHPVAARYWEMTMRINRRSPVEGLGRLLRTSPELI